MPAKPRSIVVAIAITLLVILMLQNMRSIPLNFIAWSQTMPVALVVLIAFGLGFGVAWFWKRR